MFHSTVTAPAPPADVTAPSDPIPLSVLALDLPEPPAGGWVAYLSGRGIEVVPGDIGRPAIARGDAKQLILEKQQGEAHAREVAARQERAAVERDRAFRAALPAGLHWTDIPVGATAADVWAQTNATIVRADDRYSRMRWRTRGRSSTASPPNRMRRRDSPEPACG